MLLMPLMRSTPGFWMAARGRLPLGSSRPFHQTLFNAVPEQKLDVTVMRARRTSVMLQG